MLRNEWEYIERIFSLEKAMWERASRRPGEFDDTVIEDNGFCVFV